MLDGGPGLAATPGRQAAFRRAAEQAHDTAAALRPRNVNVLAGFPELHGFGRERCLATLAENLRVAADLMGGIGIGVVVEAVNTVDRPGFLLSTSEQALEAIDRAGHPNLALEHDLYHMAIMEGRLVPRLGEILPRIGHIQFADHPGRHEPGTGAIDFPAVFAALDRLGYDGWCAAEYVPSRVTEETLGWMAENRALERRRNFRLSRRRPLIFGIGAPVLPLAAVDTVCRGPLRSAEPRATSVQDEIGDHAPAILSPFRIAHEDSLQLVNVAFASR